MHGDLRKVHSVDTDQKGRENPPLMHSVSIVVELATMEQPPSVAQAGRAPEVANQPRVDNDDDDDDSESMSTDLARKVVLVDEADKILRSRAQSAEPRFDFDSNGARPPTGKPPVPPRLAEQRQRQHRQSLACMGATCGGSSSSGELAERGELSKLGMRRFTHHQVGPGAVGAPSDASPLADSSGAVANRAPQTLNSVESPSSLFLASLQKQPPVSLVKTWQQRRQSLQISLLTGSSTPNKSLTEEEFRGEREFNEQVRNSKSPEIPNQALVQQQQQQQLNLRRPTKSPEVHSESRCKSATTEERSASTCGNSPRPHGIVKTCHHQADRPSSGQRRRVSFSSIDPVLAYQGNLVKSRASFAFFPEPDRQQRPTTIAPPAGKATSELTDTARIQFGPGQQHKRHSIATSASRPSRGQVKELIQEQHGRRCSAATWRVPNQTSTRSMPNDKPELAEADQRSASSHSKSQEFSSPGEC